MSTPLGVVRWKGKSGAGACDAARKKSVARPTTRRLAFVTRTIVRSPCMRSLILAAILTLAGCAKSATPPPQTPERPVTDSYFGAQVVDNYRWLENASDPETHAWAQAQTERARTYIDALPYRR